MDAEKSSSEVPKFMAKNDLHGSSECSASSSSSSSEETSAPSSPLVLRERVTAKSRPPLFMVAPNYVPRVPDPLDPSVPLSPLGPAINVTDGCVIIQSKRDVPSLDAGTSLFLEGGKPLGQIYETFGPVSTPFYVVVLPNSPCLGSVNKSVSKNMCRTKKRSSLSLTDQNGISAATSEVEDSPKAVMATATDPEPESILDTGDEVETVEVAATGDVKLSPHDPTESIDADATHEPLNTAESVPMVANDCGNTLPVCPADKPVPVIPTVRSGDMVYFVRDNPDLTIPVFYAQLVQMKGSDASWVNDMEPPPEELEFSDDEQERLHKRNLRTKRKNPASANNSDMCKANVAHPSPSTSSSSFARHTPRFRSRAVTNNAPLTSTTPASSGWLPAWTGHSEPAPSVPFCSIVPPPASIPMVAQPRPHQHSGYNLSYSRPPFSSPIPSLPTSTAWPPQAPYGSPTDWPQPTWCPAMTTSSSPAFSHVTSGHGSWNSTFVSRWPCDPASMSAPGLVPSTTMSSLSCHSFQPTSSAPLFSCPGTYPGVRTARTAPLPSGMCSTVPCAIMCTGVSIGSAGPTPPMSTVRQPQPLQPFAGWSGQSRIPMPVSSLVRDRPAFTRYPPPAVGVQQPVMRPPCTVPNPATFTAPSCPLTVPPPGSQATNVFSLPPYRHFYGQPQPQQPQQHQFS